MSEHLNDKDIRIRQLEEELKARERMTQAAEREINRVWDVSKLILSIGTGLALLVGAIFTFLGFKSWSDFKSELQKTEEQVLTNEVKKIQNQVSDELQRQFAATNIQNLIYSKTKEQVNSVAVPMVNDLVQLHVYPIIEASSNQIESLRSNVVSAESILRGVFASDKALTFDFNKPNSCIIQSNSPSSPPNNYMIWWLLPDCPLQGSLRLQYHVFSQPPGSYQSMGNVMIFHWGESIESLRAHPFYVWYVADTTQTNIMRSLVYTNGGVFPSDQLINNASNTANLQ